MGLRNVCFEGRSSFNGHDKGHMMVGGKKMRRAEQHLPGYKVGSRRSAELFR